MNGTSDIKDLLLKAMRTAYDAEKTLCRKLPDIKARAQGGDLKELLGAELKTKNRNHERLNAAFAALKENPDGIHDELTRQLNKAQVRLTEKDTQNAGSDLVIIMLNHAITIHQINTYQVAIACAHTLGYTEITRILRRALLSEKDIGRKLKALETISDNFNSKIIKAVHE